VQLENQPAVRYKPFVLRPAMPALTAKEPLIPATARFDVAHADEWLESHVRWPGRSVIL
jgi:hypothetical protein